MNKYKLNNPIHSMFDMSLPMPMQMAVSCKGIFALFTWIYHTLLLLLICIFGLVAQFAVFTSIAKKFTPSYFLFIWSFKYLTLDAANSHSSQRYYSFMFTFDMFLQMTYCRRSIFTFITRKPNSFMLLLQGSQSVAKK